MKVKFIMPAGETIADVAGSFPLSEHFKLSELANTSGDAALPMYEMSENALQFLQILERFRVRIDKPLDPVSCYRQPGFNAQVGGDKNSLHLHGCACDFNKYKDRPDNFIIAQWLLALSDYDSIGAINIYAGRYHVEAGSDKYLGYTRSQIRIYSSDADFSKYKYLYKDKYDVKRYYEK